MRTTYIYLRGYKTEPTEKDNIFKRKKKKTSIAQTTNYFPQL